MKVKHFEDLVFDKFGYGERALIFFDNGFGASVIKHADFVVADANFPYELAVLDGDKDQWGLCFTTSITQDNCLGSLSKNDVTRYLIKIQNLNSDGVIYDGDYIPF